MCQFRARRYNIKARLVSLLAAVLEKPIRPAYNRRSINRRSIDTARTKVTTCRCFCRAFGNSQSK